MLLIGKIYIQLGREVESAAFFWKVHQIDPENLEIKNYVSIMTSKMKECIKEAERNLLRNNHKCAILWLSKGLRFYPNHPELLLMRCSIYKKNNNLVEAVKDLDLVKNHLDKVEFTEKIKNTISNTYNDLSIRMIKEGYTEEAIRLISEALVYCPNNIYLHMNKGDCHFQEKNYNTALQSYLKAYSIDPNIMENKARISLVYYKFAILHYKAKSYHEMKEYIDKAIDICPNSSDYYILNARYFMITKDKQNAFLEVEKALKINPKNKNALLLIQSIRNL